MPICDRHYIPQRTCADELHERRQRAAEHDGHAQARPLRRKRLHFPYVRQLQGAALLQPFPQVLPDRCYLSELTPLAPSGLTHVGTKGTRSQVACITLPLNDLVKNT